MTEQEIQEAKNGIAIVGIQMETLAEMPTVKRFIELSKSRELMIKTLPKPDENGDDK